MNRPIACHLHDYIETACLYGYRVRLTLRSGAIMEGRAIDTGIDTDRREYLLLQGRDKQKIDLGQIKTLEVLSPDPIFAVVHF